MLRELPYYLSYVLGLVLALSDLVNKVHTAGKAVIYIYKVCCRRQTTEAAVNKTAVAAAAPQEFKVVTHGRRKVRVKHGNHT